MHVFLKKPLLYLFSFIILYSLNLVSVYSAYLPAADVNSDGKVDIVDIGIVIDNYAKIPIQLVSADVNRDGIVNIIDIGLIIDNYGGSSSSTNPPIIGSWEKGSTRYLPEISGDLVLFTSSLPHPNSSFQIPSTTRSANFDTFFNSLIMAVSQTRGNLTTDWCSVKNKASAAGYTVSRFYDTSTGRYFIFAKDATNEGQAYFFLNPDAKRNIVLESPHSGYETNTDTQGVRTLTMLAGRGLILNGSDRCGTNLTAQCTGSSSACGNYKASDVPHDSRNLFQRAHIILSSQGSTKFVQFHGMGGSSSDVAELSDGSTGTNNSSVSVKMAQALKQSVFNPQAIYSCQAGNTPSGLCGTTNLQGRYTNGGGGSGCLSASTTSSGRFIHIEQVPGLRDDSESDGLSWRNVAGAIQSVWPECSLGSSPSDCSLGQRQTQTPNCTCGSGCH